MCILIRNVCRANDVAYGPFLKMYLDYYCDITEHKGLQCY